MRCEGDFSTRRKRRDYAGPISSEGCEGAKGSGGETGCKVKDIGDVVLAERNGGFEERTPQIPTRLLFNGM